MARDKQLRFIIPEHGGKRRGAGRRKGLLGQPNHVKRSRLSGREPIGITLKLREGFRSLRSAELAPAAARAFERAKVFGLRVIHFSLQSNHLHLICEASSKEAVERGMRSMNVSLARAIQKINQRAGKVFNGRYHAHVLTTPTEVRNALKYVLFNWSKHLGTRRCVDPFSSIYTFQKLDPLVSAEERDRFAGDLAEPPRWNRALRQALSEAATWLLRAGWQRVALRKP